ncbi:rhodanese-like domain-containing protein [Flavobacterium sp. XS1P32]|uniref:rhodanese-like domain-containing protein n=1 Tax=Flavobacterium sp. XS1P32 TaxID=3401726 RepID=UPI003AB10062
MGFFNKVFGESNNENLATLVNEGAFLVDVRSPGEFVENNVKGSTNIPLDQVSCNLDKFKGKEKIVVFCRSGNRSDQAKTILEQKGFNNVTNGGTWQDVNVVINK